MSALNHFAGMNEAAIPGNRVYLQPGGVYDLEIKGVALGNSQKPGKRSTTYTGFTFQILGSNHPAHPVGSIASYTETSEKDGWLGRVRALLLAVVQVEDPTATVNAVTDEVAAYLCDKQGEQILGYRLRCVTSERTTKAGSTVTNHTWMPLGLPAETN